MPPPNYEYICYECEAMDIQHFPLNQRPDVSHCSRCGLEVKYTISAPAFTKASYLDGTKRKGWADLREANRLSKEASVSRKETAKEIRQEIKRMKVKVEQ